ncbi:MAG TPA: winged helix-turn-helix domain-containing protein [Acidobacteriaceae bacterium]|nr:winged helix-turn-helix domain-containing protein [Acidobacteriaceae bacterium]
MKAHRNSSTPSGARQARLVKLLLVGRDHEFDDHVTRRIFDSTQPWVASRSATLLGALDRLQSDTIDVVLLGCNFRGAELELFVGDARRNGFDGLILQAAVIKEPRPGLLGTSYNFGLSASLDSIRGTPSGRSFTPRQKAVLIGVCKGWTNQEVAGHLKCSEGAVKAILQQLFEKIGVRKRAQIVRFALEQGLIDADETLKAHSALAKEATHLPVPMGRRDESKPISIGHFVLDILMHRVWVRGTETHLTPKEFWLLAFFVTHPGELVESNALCEIFWRNPTSKHDALRVLVAGLRAKIEVSKTPQYLVTERSYGYRFNPFPALSGTGEGTPPASGVQSN